ncbi:hypothetical protein HPB51_023414 [Rhipicephalus microplus]|uniref:Uncharacterized protein n=1 Tax=Rhipicephalus microplus TaxID=6941 RepID=A0A9J6DXN4_RHIMP|nr:hypothetical protein HPB51_023414 [Rhipicephalus microplus]
MEAAGLDAASMDVWEFEVMQKYEDCSTNLEDVCLVDFVPRYSYKKCRDSAVIRYRCYSIDSSSNYKREAATLFLSLKSICTLLSVDYTDPFGSLDFIMRGGLRQLPPVRASVVYKRSRTRDIVFNTHVTWDHLLYISPVQVVHQSDAKFSSALSKLGDGHALEQAEVQMLQACLVSKDHAKLHCLYGVRLLYSNKEAEAYNMQDVVEVMDAIYKAYADDTTVGYHSDANCEIAKHRLHSLTIAEVRNLLSKLVLCLEKPYMLTLHAYGVQGQHKYMQVDEVGIEKRVWLHFHPEATDDISQMKSKSIREVCGPAVPVGSVPIERHAATITMDKKKTGVASRRENST